MNLIWLEDFVALAATGNFSRAAEDRHSSQPAFSRRIRALEEWVGADLFDRSSQPAQLTEVGEWFAGVAQELIARVARIPGDARRVAQASSLTLRIASTHVLSFTFLPRWLRGLESTMALGPVELMSDVLQRCEALMLQSKVQFVLSHSHPDARGALDREPFSSALVGEDVLIAVSAPGRGRQAASSAFTTEPDPPWRCSSTPANQGLGRIMHAVVGRRLEPFRWRSSSRRTSPPCCGPWCSTEGASPGCRERWWTRTSPMARLSPQRARIGTFPGDQAVPGCPVAGQGRGGVLEQGGRGIVSNTDGQRPRRQTSKVFYRTARESREHMAATRLRRVVRRPGTWSDAWRDGPPAG